MMPNSGIGPGPLLSRASLDFLGPYAPRSFLIRLGPFLGLPLRPLKRAGKARGFVRRVRLFFAVVAHWRLHLPSFAGITQPQPSS